MCGINGIFAYHYAANPVDRAELLRTRDHMVARGPDGKGEWCSDDGRLGLGHRRLAIIDLSETGAQPMASADGTLSVTFNGEIYNHRELRRGLEARGRVFRSQSDTEVLLHLYAEKGAEMVKDLRGMFAFAIWDSSRRQLFLARDPYGIKPLYYADDGWTFRFASQVKALVAGGGVSQDVDPAGLVGFFTFGSVPEPYTTLQAVRCLPAGTTMIVSNTGAGEPLRYHSIAEAWRHGESDPGRVDDAAGAVREALLDSVRLHLVSDVPVGAFLSAGIDSGALVGLMRDAGASDIATVTVSFDEFRGCPQDEAPLAEAVARYYGTRHRTYVVQRAEFDADLPRILAAMDQPSIDGVNTWFVAKAAAQAGLKVAVSGLGGDELFGGYPSFRDIPRWLKMVALPSRFPFLGRLMRSVAPSLLQPFGVSPKAAGLVELGRDVSGAYLLRRGLFMPWELASVVDPEIVRAGLRRLVPVNHIEAQIDPPPGSRFAQIASLEASLYMRNQLLRDTDWASMAHSLEVRVPLVDHVLLSKLSRFQAELSQAPGKALLAQAPARPLPVSVTGRAKTGFTTPVELWMKDMSMRGKGPANQSPAREPWARQWSRSVAAQPAVATGA